MELKRDIYEKLLNWKKADRGHVLELRGARQVGKTYILDKFARENYQKYIYINMVQISGKEFLACLDKVMEWEPGDCRREKPLHDAFLMFNHQFDDTKETVIIIDEIQESAKVYSLIRQFAREFTCHFVVTGSYLGKTLSEEYFQPVGDLDIMTLYPLSYEEFLDALGKRKLYDELDLYGNSEHEKYDELREYFECYCKVGGYPAVVKKFLETDSYKAATEELYRVIHIFIEESQHYFNNVLEMNLFEQLFPAIAQTMVKEKKGSKDLITELSKIIYQEESGRISKKNINQAIAWLYRSHIVGFCGKADECSLMNATMNNRFYFMDLGVCRYFLNMAGVDEATLRGVICENFVYVDLLKRIQNFEIAGAAPMFGTYKDGEIDFLVNNRENYMTYGVEVKAGATEGRTADVLLKDGKVEAVYFLKGVTYGGIESRKITIPIYLVRRVEFDYKREQN